MSKKLFAMENYTDTSIVLANPSVPAKKLELEIVENKVEQKKKNLPEKKSKHKTWISRLKNKIFHPAETKQKNNVALIRHVSCMFVMDVSESMNYPKENPNIKSLNHALQEFKKNMTEACQKCHVQMDVGMVTFHGAEAKIITPFTPMSEWCSKRFNFWIVASSPLHPKN